MDWEKIIQLIQAVIKKVRADYVLNNMIIKDDIFGILEKHCTWEWWDFKQQNKRLCIWILQSCTSSFIKWRIDSFWEKASITTWISLSVIVTKKLDHLSSLQNLMQLIKKWRNITTLLLFQQEFENQKTNRMQREM